MRSKTVTARPARASTSAAIRPAGPPPTTATLGILIKVSTRMERCHGSGSSAVNQQLCDAQQNQGFLKKNPKSRRSTGDIRPIATTLKIPLHRNTRERPMFSNDNQDKSIQMNRVLDRRSVLLGSTTLAAASALSSALETAQAQQPPAAAAGSTTNANRLVRTFTGSNHEPISCIAVSLDGTRIVSGSGLGSEGVSFWNLNSGDMLHNFALGDGGADSVAFSPDGRTAAAASIDDQIIAWDTSSFNQVGLIRANVGVRTNRVAFSLDGQLVLSVYDSNLVLLDTALHQKSAIRTPPGSTVFAAAFSPEARFVVAGSVRFDRGDDIVVYDLLSGQQTIHFSGHPGAGATSVAWSGNTILSGSGDGSVKLWNSASGAAIRSFAGHTKPVHTVALDSSGALALSGSDDGTMKLWAVGSGAALQTFDHADGAVTGVAFASGARFAVSGGGKTVKLWDLSGLAS